MTDSTKLRHRCEREKQRLLALADRLRQLIANEDYGMASELIMPLDCGLESLNRDANELADKE